MSPLFGVIGFWGFWSFVAWAVVTGHVIWALAFVGAFLFVGVSMAIYCDFSDPAP